MVVLDNLGERSIEDWAMTDAGAWLHLTYVPTSSLESGKKDLVQRTARCSWCFKETTHTRVRAAPRPRAARLYSSEPT